MHRRSDGYQQSVIGLLSLKKDKPFVYVPHSQYTERVDKNRGAIWVNPEVTYRGNQSKISEFEGVVRMRIN